MKIEQVPIEKLKVNERNPRLNDKAVDAVAKSIEAFGFNVPIITDGKLKVAAGHTRLKAAHKLGLTTVPVIRVPKLKGSTFHGFSIADNQTASIADWDEDLLKGLVVELNAEDEFDLATLGFSPAELQKLVEDTTGNGKDDEVPDPPKKAITKKGDIWLLGGHKLLCGDATDKGDVGRLCEAVTPFIMVTDPPYGVNYDPKWRKDVGLNNSTRMGKVQNDDRVDWSAAWTLFLGDVAYVWHGALYTGQVAENISSSGIQIRAHLIWRKPGLVVSRGHYHWQHESCWYGVRKGKTSRWCGDRSQSTIWDITNKSDEGKTDHGTQKPVECMARPIRNHGAKGDVVYDPFVGSGTTIIAAEKLERLCLAIDIDPVYCDVAVERWENFTGQKAKRARR